jgi:Zn-finger protein
MMKEREENRGQTRKKRNKEKTTGKKKRTKKGKKLSGKKIKKREYTPCHKGSQSKSSFGQSNFCHTCIYIFFYIKNEGTKMKKRGVKGERDIFYRKKNRRKKSGSKEDR